MRKRSLNTDEDEDGMEEIAPPIVKKQKMQNTLNNFVIIRKRSNPHWKIMGISCTLKVL